jgi:predicted MFS family arabinose efflux permease
MMAQIGAAIAPLMVVPIQARYGWQASFFVFGFLGVIWAAVWYAWFRDSPREMAGISPLERQEIGEDPPASHSGFPWRPTLRSGTLWRITGIGVCYVYSIAFFQSWLQTYLVRGHGYTEAALMLSSLPYLVGAAANGVGGLASDWLVQRFGLRSGRRALGVFGLSFAAVFMAATIAATDGVWALAFLSLAYAGILVQQPNLCAVCLDTGRKHGGAVFGFMNSAANGASAVSSIVFGYLVGYTGNYNAPFVPMVALLCVGAWLWLTVDPARQLFEVEAVVPSHAAVVPA